MFGKPHWFRAKSFGWGLVPIRWQGWVYSAAWIAAIGLPFVLLLLRHQPLEAAAWLSLSVGALTYDVWQILGVVRSHGSGAPRARAAGIQRDDRVLYISDSQSVARH